jgi:hypothetical protein
MIRIGSTKPQFYSDSKNPELPVSFSMERDLENEVGFRAIQHGISGHH